MDYLAMLNTVIRRNKNAEINELSTEFKYTGLQEYPRPQLQRKSYINLNGQWDFRIIDGQGKVIEDGKIEVPFSPEARLSNTSQHTLLPDETLEYKLQINIDKIKEKKRLILHFGAVDQVAHVMVNGRKIGEHHGGYTSFSFDITDYLIVGENELKLKVRDYMDKVGYARGKQSLEPGGMWYSAQSGIWQTVWMEWVPEVYVSSLSMIPDIDNKMLHMRLGVSGAKGQVTVDSSNQDLIKDLEVRFISDHELAVDVYLDKFKLWTPEEPNLCFMNVSYGKDKFSTYFAMRKFGVGKDDNGIPRLTLNNKPYFLNGVLDQGYYPESLMTPPSDAAMIYDIETMKDLGFNMLRKHCKIEPMRWYFHCDRIGMVVWQDIVNGGTKYDMNMICNVPTVVRPFGNARDKNRLFLRFTGRREQKAKDLWYHECSELMNQLISVPSIGLWTLFNEGWGQFDARKCLDFAKAIDSSRPFDAASGWFHEDCGDVLSEHKYFEELSVKNTKVPYVLSEYGGFSLMVGQHSYREAMYGYKIFSEPTELQKEYDKTMEKIKALIPEGLSAAVFTQVTDIEDELNGLLTYDRKTQKLY